MCTSISNFTDLIIHVIVLWLHIVSKLETRNNFSHKFVSKEVGWRFPKFLFSIFQKSKAENKSREHASISYDPNLKHLFNDSIVVSDVSSP